MVYFQTRNRNLGQFWRVLQWNMLVYFRAIWSTHFTAICYILWSFGIYYGYLVYFSVLVFCGEPRKIWQP
jgi:hypothetical protein